MGCLQCPQCGGCTQRELNIEEYQSYKASKVKNILDKGLLSKDYIWEKPIFLDDGTRRRAALAFKFAKSHLTLGFNAENSNEIIDCTMCRMLTKPINQILPALRQFLENFCKIPLLSKSTKGKSKKQIVPLLQNGDVLLLEADNGLDIVLEADIELGLNHRLEIFDFVNAYENIIRFSHRRKNNEEAEPIIEKTKPVININDINVFVAPGMFLQASKAGQDALISIVTKYIGEISGTLADLFCGVGTFTYPLAAKGFKIEAYDVNEALLNGFRQSVNRHMLHNVRIFQQNLFKNPLDTNQLAKFEAVIFDPPRAGAMAQVKQIAKLDKTAPLHKIVAVSCNPHSFVNDADILTESGFKLEKVTLVDQFVYSEHSELVALFTK